MTVDEDPQDRCTRLRPPSLDDDAIDAIARRVVQLLERDVAEPSGRRLVSAADIAQRYDVSRQWVYENANRLGVVRLSGGVRPRLRFDPALVEQQLGVPEGDSVETSATAPNQERAKPADLIPLREL